MWKIANSEIWNCEFNTEMLKIFPPFQFKIMQIIIIIE